MYNTSSNKVGTGIISVAGLNPAMMLLCVVINFQYSLLQMSMNVAKTEMIVLTYVQILKVAILAPVMLATT